MPECGIRRMPRGLAVSRAFGSPQEWRIRYQVVLRARGRRAAWASRGPDAPPVRESQPAGPMPAIMPTASAGAGAASPAHAARLHEMDNLRAAMMWLGVVLHAADLHTVSFAAIHWRDPARTELADLLVFVIHAFRMPAFFIVAGFFVALLASRRGLPAMLRHRALRVGLPLLLFWPPLFALMVVLANLHALPPGAPPTFSLDLQAMPQMPDGTRLQLMHLWFLQVLLGLAAATCVIGLVLPGRWRTALPRRAAAAMLHPLALPALALVQAVSVRHHPFGVFAASALWLPPLHEWVFHGLFFAYGLALYTARERMLPRLQAACVRLAGLGLVALVAAGGLAAGQFAGRPALPYAHVWTGFAYTACGWLWSLALIGAFARWLRRRSAATAYLADSAYWVYLVHLPLIVALDLVLRGWDVPALVKLGTCVAVATAGSLLSYQLLVRHTPLGTLLNGRRGAG